MTVRNADQASHPQEQSFARDEMNPPKTTLQLAMSWPVVKRGLLCALIVGSVLCAINHGDCLISGHFGWPCFAKSAITAIVPYMVSVVSSVHALRHQGVT